VQGTAALEVQREILADHAADTSSAAQTLRVQAFFYALKNNSWQSVQLLLDSGIMFPNWDAALKGLYPRERGLLLNDDTAVPTSLYTYMSMKSVKESTVDGVIQDYKLGNFPEEVFTELGIKQVLQRSSQPEVNTLSLLFISLRKRMISVEIFELHPLL
jgi:hypothetical protein